MDTITLRCPDCGHDWQHPQTRGTNPARCRSCHTAERSARRILDLAHERDLHQAQVVNHDRHGWICVIPDAFRDGSAALLRDAVDVAWFQTEHRADLVAA